MCDTHLSTARPKFIYFLLQCLHSVIHILDKPR